MGQTRSTWSPRDGGSGLCPPREPTFTPASALHWTLREPELPEHLLPGLMAWAQPSAPHCLPYPGIWLTLALVPHPSSSHIHPRACLAGLWRCVLDALSSASSWSQTVPATLGLLWAPPVPASCPDSTVSGQVCPLLKVPRQ